ncbi:MAG TPA: glycerol-3-phosphate 1-O-acyltransferase PlsY [Terriglobia bacterium]|nr:glycerol-3-phosphate 1-O-acyltransferase PlsY [Terriglobia bacterium]
MSLLICFLLGSIPFAVISMLGTGIDIRKVGSGNPGFNNVLRVSKPRAVLALIGDMGKGALAVWLFYKAGDPVALGWLFGFAAILGHCYSPFLKFNGGKGIATSGGVMQVLYPNLAMVALVVFVIIRVTGSKLKWREAGAIASIGTWMIFSVVIFIWIGKWDGIYAGLMTLLLIWRHKKNVQNLFSARETEKKR